MIRKPARIEIVGADPLEPRNVVTAGDEHDDRACGCSHGE